MNLKASDIIATLTAAIQKHGDLPCYLEDSDIESMRVHPTIDGRESFENGKRIGVPTEFTLVFLSKGESGG